MNNLITVEELKSFKDIGNKVDIHKINPIIQQSQDIDLRDFLGMKFYFDVLANVENLVYQDLLNGSTFNYQNVQFRHDGIKGLLADLFMSRYAMQINTNFTPFGAVVKKNEDSEPASDNSLRNKSQIEKEAAGSKWEIIKLYLEINKHQFPNYNTHTDTISSGERKLKFRKI